MTHQNHRPISCYRSPKIEVRSGAIEGRGVFATQRIKEGEMVAIKAGHIVTQKELAEITVSVGDFALQIHDEFYLSPKTPDDVERMTVFINHSCDPNVGFCGDTVYVAMRTIEPGEELCHDYSMARSDNYTLQCKCGANCCRDTIRGDDWKRQDLQKKYSNRFSTYILEKIAAQR